MLGARVRVDAISWPQVKPVVLVAINMREKRPKANAEGLNMCELRPSRFQRTYSLPMKPTAIITNCM